MGDQLNQNAAPPLPQFVATVRERHCDSSRDKEVRSDVTDLGEAGVFIAMQEPPPKGTILEVEFEVPGLPGRRRVLGIVRWRETAGPRAGAGVRLAPIGETERALFAEIIRKGSKKQDGR